MMKTITLIFFAFMVLISFSCKKTSSQYSHWKINSDSFTSTNIAVQVGNGQSEMRSDGSNYYDFVFDGSGMLLDEALIGIPSAGYDVSVLFVNNGISYSIPTTPNQSLIKKIINNKTYFYLPPTWFYGQSKSDSALITGMF